TPAIAGGRGDEGVRTVQERIGPVDARTGAVQLGPQPLDGRPVAAPRLELEEVQGEDQLRPLLAHLSRPLTEPEQEPPCGFRLTAPDELHGAGPLDVVCDRMGPQARGTRDRPAGHREPPRVVSPRPVFEIRVAGRARERDRLLELPLARLRSD